VVLDGVCGPPLLAALKATRWGARILTIGTGAGRDIQLNIADLLFRTLTCVGTGQRSPSDRQATWRRLLQLAREHQITFDHVGYRFDQMPEAWNAQVAGPHAKITASFQG
jgi:NADPH:quinone reductase